MSIHDARRTIALREETTSRLKAFAQQHDLKMYKLVEAMAQLLIDNEYFAAKAVEVAKANEEAEKAGQKLFSAKMKNLPKDAQAKLKGLSASELEQLLKNLK